jgi:hypothetical protein
VNEQESKKIRRKLERELGSPFLDPTWERFKESCGFEEYRQGKLDWQDLIDLAEEDLA